MSQVTSYCHRAKALDRLYQPYNKRKERKAGDQFHNVLSELASPRNEWIRPMVEPNYPAPLDDSFSKIQHFRRPTPREANQLRFEINLWASVDIRKPVRPQIADGLRRMAQFLMDQASRVDAEKIFDFDAEDLAQMPPEEAACLAEPDVAECAKAGVA